MKKIILSILLILLSNTLYANQKECLKYLNKSNEFQDEMVTYMMNGLDMDTYHAAKQALRYSIKAKTKCKKILKKEDVNFDKKIVTNHPT